MARSTALFVALSTLLVPLVQAQETTAPKWGQCGGAYYTGPTACPAGFACEKQTDRFSQCVPAELLPSPPAPTSSSSWPGGTVSVSQGPVTRSTYSFPSASAPVTTTWTSSAAPTTAPSGSISISRTTWISSESVPRTTDSATVSATRVSSTISPTLTRTTANPSPTLRTLDALARGRSKFVGVALDVNHIPDEAYFARMLTEFGQITPENSQKWETSEPQPGVFNYTSADRILELARSRGKTIRGHTLVWHSQLPAWVSEGNWTKEALTEVIVNHVTNLTTHFKGKIHTWDVVNEALNEDGTMRESLFYNVLGEEYIDIAFKAARAADPDAILAINDYNVDGAGAKSTGMINLVTRLKSRGVPVDQIGAQAHLVLGTLPTTIEANWRAFAALNVSVAVTEVDIRMQLPVTEEKLEQQATDYTTVFNACFAIPRCLGVTVWGGSDKYSWVPEFFEGEGAPLLWDEDMAPKPAFYAVVDVLSP